MYVLPSAPQGHQYGMAYTWDNPVLHPAFLEGRRTVTRVLAKPTKAKNNSINGKKKFKRIDSCLFGRRRKVQVMNLPSRTPSLLSVLLRTRSVQRLSPQHLPAVPTPNIAELVPSGFFCPNHGFCGGPNAFSQEKHHHFHVDKHLVKRKEISSKINFYKLL